MLQVREAFAEAIGLAKHRAEELLDEDKGKEVLDGMCKEHQKIYQQLEDLFEQIDRTLESGTTESSKRHDQGGERPEQAHQEREEERAGEVQEDKGVDDNSMPGQYGRG